MDLLLRSERVRQTVQVEVVLAQRFTVVRHIDQGGVERLVARVEAITDDEHRCQENLLKAEHRYEQKLADLHGRLDDLRVSVRKGG